MGAVPATAPITLPHTTAVRCACQAAGTPGCEVGWDLVVSRRNRRWGSWRKKLLTEGPATDRKMSSPIYKRPRRRAICECGVRFEPMKPNLGQPGITRSVTGRGLVRWRHGVGAQRADCPERGDVPRRQRAMADWEEHHEAVRSSRTSASARTPNVASMWICARPTTSGSARTRAAS